LLQQRRDLVLRVSERESGKGHASQVRHRNRSVRIDAKLAGQLRLVGDDDRQAVLWPDDVCVNARCWLIGFLRSAAYCLGYLEVRLVGRRRRRGRRCLSGDGRGKQGEYEYGDAGALAHECQSYSETLTSGIPSCRAFRYRFGR